MDAAAELANTINNALQDELANFSERRATLIRHIDQAQRDLDRMSLELRLLEASIKEREAATSILLNLLIKGKDT